MNTLVLEMIVVVAIAAAILQVLVYSYRDLRAPGAHWRARRGRPSSAGGRPAMVGSKNCNADTCPMPLGPTPPPCPQTHAAAMTPTHLALPLHLRPYPPYLVQTWLLRLLTDNKRMIDNCYNPLATSLPTLTTLTRLMQVLQTVIHALITANTAILHAANLLRCLPPLEPLVLRRELRLPAAQPVRLLLQPLPLRLLPLLLPLEGRLLVRVVIVVVVVVTWWHSSGSRHSSCRCVMVARVVEVASLGR